METDHIHMRSAALAAEGQEAVMKALVYHGPGRRSWESVPDPVIQNPTDAIVRIDTVTICGTDLHILGGDVPTCEPGRILGHEAVGTVVETGAAVAGITAGQRVLVSCISSCGVCRFCREGSYGQCLGGGGWILGHRINGVQAQLARIPFAATSLHPLPDSVTDEAAVLLADILPTSYEVGVLNGAVRPGDTVVIVGAGPIGLAAIATARLFSPSAIIVIDKAAARLEAAAKLGATLVLQADDAVRMHVFEQTGDLGADVAIEAVGVPETFELCTRLIRPGGRVANVGVHGKPATLHLEDLWIRNVTVTTGLVDTYTTPTLLRMLAAGQLDVDGLVTHRFGIDEMQDAYDVFSRPQESGALKVVLFRT
jgi:alcohol dehydrogenase